MSSQIRVCLPKGDRHGWGVAGQKILNGLAKLVEIGYPTDPKHSLLMAIRGADGLPMEYLPRGPKNVGYGFIEQGSIAQKHLHNFATYYDTVVCGSSWMQLRMKEIGIQDTRTVLQGVDYEVFKPAEPVKKDHFTVFSGGKFEFRKGQDFVIAAMRVFMERHKDVHLLASWMNLWPITMHGMTGSRVIDYRSVSDDWRTQVLTTMKENGIPLDRVTLAGDGPHESMADFYRQCDVGLFPNRCEAGTNLVMSEAIACGLPVIASPMTGHKDLRRVISYWLEEGSECGPDQWWAPFEIDEMLTHLENSYQNRQRARIYGLSGAEKIREIVSWDKCCEGLLEALGVAKEAVA